MRERFVRAVVFWAAVLGAAAAARRFLLPCLGPFLAGWGAAALLRPCARWLSGHTFLGKKSASVLTLLVFWTGAGLLVWWLGASAFSQGAALLERLPGWYQRAFLPTAREVGKEAMHILGRMGGPEAETTLQGMTDRLGPLLQESVSTLSARALAAAGSLAGRFPSALLACSFALLSSFFILPDYEGIGAFLLGQLPPRLAEMVQESKDFLVGTVRQVLKAYLLIMAITFGEISLGLWLLRVDYYLIIGLTVAVLDILPVLGSGSILIPWGIWTLLGGNLPLGAGILLLYAVVTGVRTVLEPRLVGRGMGLSPLVTLISMYVGMKLLGVGGLILAPMAVTLVLFLEESGHIRLLRKKGGRRPGGSGV